MHEENNIAACEEISGIFAGMVMMFMGYSSNVLPRGTRCSIQRLKTRLGPLNAAIRSKHLQHFIDKKRLLISATAMGCSELISKEASGVDVQPQSMREALDDLSRSSGSPIS
jgi:hypothetical protein